MDGRLARNIQIASNQDNSIGRTATDVLIRRRSDRQGIRRKNITIIDFDRIKEV